jgi:hypothetical protein
MKLAQIQRMATPGLALTQRSAVLSFLASPRIQADTVISRPSLLDYRYLSSLSRYGKSLEQLAFARKLRTLSLPEVKDGVVETVVEPLRPVVFPEQPEMEFTRVLWVSQNCNCELTSAHKRAQASDLIIVR